MRRFLHTALGIWLVIVMTMVQGCAAPAQNAANSGASSGSSAQYAGAQKSNHSGGSSNTAGYVPDSGASTALTDYLKRHRLPLVGAQVMRNPNNGARTVVLYGFVGSDYGKSDAQRQAESYINDAAVDVDNRIRVNPDLLTAGKSPSAPSVTGPTDMDDEQAQANSSMPGAQSYVDQENQAAAQVQQYQQQNSAASMSSMLPLIALLGMLSMSSGGGSFSTGPPMGYSPYGNSPFGYSPYANSPYGSPYSPYASPIPPSNFGSPGFGYGSPGGGVTPFGSLPGSPYSSFP